MIFFSSSIRCQVKNLSTHIELFQSSVHGLWPVTLGVHPLPWPVTWIKNVHLGMVFTHFQEILRSLQRLKMKGYPHYSVTNSFFTCFTNCFASLCCPFICRTDTCIEYCFVSCFVHRFTCRFVIVSYIVSIIYMFKHTVYIVDTELYSSLASL